MAATVSGRGLALVALALAGCGSGPEPPSGPGPDPGGETGGALVFADSALQAAVEEGAAAAAGSAEALLTLNAKDRGIADLGGIEQLTRLEVLDLYGNQVRDLSPLAGLRRLRYLDLGSNRVEEVSALASLKSLRVLLLAGNRVTDVSALAGLDSLQSVELTGNPLTPAAAGAQIAALRERGVTVDFEASEGTDPTEGTGGEGVVAVLGELPILFASSRRTGLRTDLEVYSLDLKTGAVVSLSEGLAAAPLAEADSVSLQRRRHGEDPAQSPDGMWIAFTSSRDGNREIYVMAADGGSPRNLTRHEARDTKPAWSPDGRRIAFVSDRPGESEQGLLLTNDIFVMNADGSGVEQLTSSRRPVRASDPAWSPDGSSIAFYMLDAEGFSEIYVLELSTGALGPVTDHRGVLWGPSWSPDGQWIAYIETVDFDESHVWKISADGGESRQLTSGRFWRGRPTWSPDGARILFAREERPGGSAEDLYMILAEGGPEEQITDDPGVDEDPCWAPF